MKNAVSSDVAEARMEEPKGDEQIATDEATQHVKPGAPEPSLEANSESPEEPLYSAFSIPQKRLIVFLVAYAAMFSPLSSFIYFPATTSLAHSLHTTVEHINLSITTYMVGSGIAPAMLGDTADKIGRRPVYLAAIAIYIAANIGLATQNNYAALLVLRIVQSVGSSGTIALGWGTVSDIASPAERGGYAALLCVGPNVAPSLGPVIGGVLAHTAGWRWIFWTLTIMAGPCLLALYLCLPETARIIVGHGGHPISRYHGLRRYIIPLQENKSRHSAGCFLPNPLTSIKIIFHRNAALVILITSLVYMVYASVQASMSSAFISLYEFNELEAGLIYIPYGAGCLLFALLSGPIMDRDYRITAKALGFVGIQRDDLEHFPIERARFRSAPIFLIVGGTAVVGYGWSIHQKINIAVPLILQFFIGGSFTVLFNICSTLLTDLHPKTPASAQAAVNIVKACLSAGGLAVVQIMINKLGTGWCFTIFGLLILSMLWPMWVECRYGHGWRKEADRKAETGETDGVVEKEK